MKQVFQKIPVYTGDVSGVCSALYELGGMVVMHDPSGCNSTYNTHDEIRWYDRDSLIFLSGLNEMDAVMGSDEKLIRDTVEAARIYEPAFIAIANSPIPYITGMDFDAICRLIEQETGIPSFYISTNGMHDYTRGAGLALLHLAERFVKPAAADKTRRNNLRCNILGMTPLDFAAETTFSNLQSKIEKAGMEIGTCWAMEDSMNRQDNKQESRQDNNRENIRGQEKTGNGTYEKDKNSLLRAVSDSASADVNLVLSSVGLPVAQYLFEQYGIPFVAGIPAAGVEEEYFASVRKAVCTGDNQFPFRERTENLTEKAEDSEAIPPVCLIGEPVIMTSLAASIQKRTGAETHVFGATESSALFLGDGDAALSGEEELESALKEIVREYSGAEQENRNEEQDNRNKEQEDRNNEEENRKNEEQGEPIRVVADPCYSGILPAGCELVRLPHLAFSGRIFLKEIPDLMQVVL